MKTITTTLLTTFFVLVSFTAKAQEGCNKTLSLFAGNVTAENYTDALPQLMYLRKNCPTINSAIYGHGEKVLKYELAKAKDKQAAAIELIQLYNDRMKYVPLKTKKGAILSKIGAVMIKHKIGSLEEQYNTFNEAFQTDQLNFKHPRYLYIYFELYHNMYTSGNYGLQLENLIEKYEAVQEKFEYEKQRLFKIKDEFKGKKELTAKENRKVIIANKNIAGIDTFTKKLIFIIEKEATCEALIPMFRKKMEENKNDLQWMKKAAGKLDAKGCKKDDLFIELVEAIDAVEPNANTKLYLHKIYESKGDIVKADEYFKQFLLLETDGVKKGKILNTKGIEATKKAQKSKARSLYLEAVKFNPSLGNAYINIARLYGSSANECGADEFSKRAIYWKAAAMARKAKQVDPSKKIEANKLINSYMNSAPSKTDIFEKGYTGGEKIIMKCWVGGTVIVPKL
jgi:TPR repeat protein